MNEQEQKIIKAVIQDLKSIETQLRDSVVFVVVSGEYGEGGTVKAVFLSLDKAIQFVTSNPHYASWSHTDTYFWECPFGVDYVRIETHQLKS